MTAYGFCCHWLLHVKSQCFPLQLAVITCTENSSTNYACELSCKTGNQDNNSNMFEKKKRRKGLQFPNHLHCDEVHPMQFHYSAEDISYSVRS